MDRKKNRPTPGAVFVLLLIGSLFAIEGNLLLHLVLWLLNLQSHWMLVGIVSVAFFYLGIIVASLMVVTSRHDDVAHDSERAANSAEHTHRPAVHKSSAEAHGMSAHKHKLRSSVKQARTVPMAEAP